MLDYQSYLGKIKKVARFLWRHCFTLLDLYLSISVFLEGNLNWRNCILLTLAAICLDWAKQFIKLTPNPNMRHSTHHGPIAMHRYDTNWSNPYEMGTEAYYMRNSGER